MLIAVSIAAAVILVPGRNVTDVHFPIVRNCDLTNLEDLENNSNTSPSYPTFKRFFLIKRW